MVSDEFLADLFCVTCSACQAVFTFAEHGILTSHDQSIFLCARQNMI